MPNPSELQRVEEEHAAALQERLYELPCHPQTHAIIAAIIGTEPKTVQRYVGKAVVTSDGFVQCSFVDGDERYHNMAFIGSWETLMENMHGVMAALELTATERLTVNQMIRDWIAVDYR